MMPKAPWPMKQAATATRKIQCKTTGSGVAGRWPIQPGDVRSSNRSVWVVAR
jgi:hypothetical protein